MPIKDTSNGVRMKPESGEKEYFYGEIEEAERKLSTLARDSRVRSALSPKMVDIRNLMNTRTGQECMLGFWPPLYCFILDNDILRLQAFEDDLAKVLNNSTKNELNRTHSILSNAASIHACEEHRIGATRQWLSWLFELSVKSRILGSASQVQLDAPTTNGRNADIRVRIGHDMCYLECTVLTDSDTDQTRWADFCRAQLADLRSCPPARTTSLPHVAYRVWKKVYDKYADRWDPSHSQLGPDGPNILLMSCGSGIGELYPDHLGLERALQELFTTELAETGEFSLLRWLEYAATEDTRSSCRLNKEEYLHRLPDLRVVRNKISAVMLFQACTLSRVVQNPNAHKPHAVCPEALSQLEHMLAEPPVWAVS